LPLGQSVSSMPPPDADAREISALNSAIDQGRRK
jgi:hypothetical protein